MKKKLDLNGLLSKYEGISNSHSVPFYSPAKNYDMRDNTMGQDFYQSRNIPTNMNNGWNNTAAEDVTYVQQNLACNFQMSKSECESFLMRIKDELRNQQRQMQGYVENAQKHIHQKFQQNHQKIRREILELLDRTFKENQRYITEELKRVGNIEPPEFIPVHKRIASIDEDISRLLYGLKGAEYRKSIAETVMKDFDSEIKSLNQNLLAARDSYQASLGEVEPDRARIDCIREDLQRLFKLSKKTTDLVMGVLGGGPLKGNQSSSRGGGIFGFGGGNESRQVAQSMPAQNGGEDASQRQRKSFFNFVMGN